MHVDRQRAEASRRDRREAFLVMDGRRRFAPNLAANK
jgi:hypothetical protein